MPETLVYLVYDGAHMMGIFTTLEKAKEAWGSLPPKEISQVIESCLLDRLLSRWDSTVEAVK